MKNPLFVAIRVFILCFILGSVSFAQDSQIDLTQVNFDEIIHVDNRNPQASDANSGTVDLPILTIQQGINVANGFNRMGRSVQILVHEGIYAEATRISQEGNTSAPMILEATVPGNVVITGSDKWTEWIGSQIPGRYIHHWAFDWGQTSISSDWSEINRVIPETIQRREIIFVNGFPLNQVFDVNALNSNTFYVDEVANAITIQLLPEVDINTLNIEVSTRDILFQINDRQNIAVRGFIFEHANTTFNSAVHAFRSQNIRFENNIFQWNNASGLGIIRSQDIVTSGNVYRDNGGTGFGAGYVDNLLSENESSYRNNWRGLQGAYIGWSVAGIKHLFMSNTTYRNLNIYDNYASGLWLDSDNTNITIEDVTIVNNLNSGLYLEASKGPFILNGVLISNNIFSGIQFANVENVTINNSVIYGNQGTQLIFTGENSGRDVTDPQTGETVRLAPMGNLTLNNNVIISDDDNAYLIRSTLSPDPWQHLLDTLTTDDNTWFTPEVGGGFNYLQQEWRFEDWQNVTRQDQNSTFTPVSYVDALAQDTVDRNFTPDLRVVQLVLMDADTDTELMTLQNDSVIALSALPTRNLNIRADVFPNEVGSVLFNLNGLYFVENIFPYAFAGNTDDNYRSWSLLAGDYYVLATPYTATGANGLVGRGRTVRFQVTE